MIKITYITVTYNAGAVLQRTLDSVLQQDYPDLVHLIIDGASKDCTLQMAEDYQHRSDEAGNGHQVLITSEPDHGIYDAMNKGLRSATGDYVCFLNAGDTLPSPDTASYIARQAEANSTASAVNPELSLPAVLYGDTDIVDNEGRFLYHRRLSPPEQLTWRSFRQGMLVCHQAFYARTDYAISCPYNQRYRYSADVDWCIRIMRQADRDHAQLLNLHRVVANYLQEGQTTQNHRQSLFERYRVMVSHYGHLTTFFMHCWFVLRSLHR